jgi:copper(I)-binding protein
MRMQTLLAALLLPISLFAADCNDMDIQFKHGYARPVEGDPMSLVAYITIINRDYHSHTLTRVSTSDPTADNINMFGPGGDVKGTTATLQPLGEIYLHANGGRYTFRPGKSHIFLGRFRDRPDPGDEISLTFTFADDCQLSANNIPVRE